MTLQELFETHAALSLEKQHALSELIGDHAWNLQLDAGTLSFGQQHTFDIQILGTESTVSQTWLWAWANRGNEIPARLLDCAQEVRELGQTQDISEFTVEQSPLEVVSGHYLALIACGLCRADCYYRAPYEGGAVFVLLRAPEVRAKLGESAERLAMVFRQLISEFDVNHRKAFASYVAQKRYAVQQTANQITATSPAREKVAATFDRIGRLTDLVIETGRRPS